MHQLVQHYRSCVKRAPNRAFNRDRPSHHKQNRATILVHSCVCSKGRHTGHLLSHKGEENHICFNSRGAVALWYWDSVQELGVPRAQNFVCDALGTVVRGVRAHTTRLRFAAEDSESEGTINNALQRSYSTPTLRLPVSD